MTRRKQAGSESAGFFRPPSLPGLAAGFVFLAASLVPGLLPRPSMVQGVVSGVFFSVGYGVGCASWALARRLWRRVRSATEPHRRLVPPVLAIPLGVFTWAVVAHLRWQVDIRSLMGMEPGSTAYLGKALVIAALVAVLLVVSSRALRAVVGRLLASLSARMPHTSALALVSTFLFVAALLFLDIVVAGQAIPALEEAHHSSDRAFDPGVEPPDSPHRAGGPGSLIEWERMGRQGRTFVTGAPSIADIQAFSNEPALDPIRVYVGLDVADAPQSRAALAIAELERTDAFDRDLIVLVAPTGSGWVDPYAVSPLEYMYNGDTAAVAIQYSYLASWMVMIRNQDLASDAAGALYRVVRQRIAEEPEGSRPKLVVYGESLGSFGWERTFSRVEDVVAGTDGALWVGPPRVNPIWRRLVAQREPGSPLWRPVFRGGETVRFGPDGQSLLAPGPHWPTPRIVYLQHASDPITWLGAYLMLERPEWLDPPRGPDVSGLMPYLPVVTYLQMAVDLALGTNAPLGHGHKFGLGQAEAWSLIVPPSGWTDRDKEHLLSRLDES